MLSILIIKKEKQTKNPNYTLQPKAYTKRNLKISVATYMTLTLY